MKLVLASAPEGVKEITTKIVELVGKPAEQIRVAVINEASAVEEGHRWLIAGLTKLAKTFGGEIDLVNLSSLDLKVVETRMSKADVIWCFGGSTDWLKLIFEKTGFETIIPKLLKNKVWVGSSAGSCIQCRRGFWKTDAKIYGGEKYFDIEDYLANVDAYVYPHCWGKYVLPTAFEAIFDASKEQKYPTYALSDKAAVIVEGKTIYMLGKKAWKIVKGKVIEKI